MKIYYFIKRYFTLNLIFGQFPETRLDIKTVVLKKKFIHKLDLVLTSRNYVGYKSCCLKNRNFTLKFYLGETSRNYFYK